MCLPVAGQPERDADLNAVLARAFALGVEVRWEALYEGRLVRPFVPADQRLFIDNPCERPMTCLRRAADRADRGASG